MTAPTTSDANEPAAAGRAEGEAFDQRLRAIEAAERDECLAGPGHQGSGRSTQYQPTLDVGRLKARMEELVAFRSAVQESLVWRAAQTLRRLFGRAW
jgi:hypothetical protein